VAIISSFQHRDPQEPHESAVRVGQAS
jgi:hypothetical protein